MGEDTRQGIRRGLLSVVWAVAYGGVSYLVYRYGVSLTDDLGVTDLARIVAVASAFAFLAGRVS